MRYNSFKEAAMDTYELGFNSSDVFTQAFKRVYNEAPTATRELRVV
jgi:AraC-like DNA-binding protein